MTPDDFTWNEYWWSRRSFVPFVGREVELAVDPEDFKRAPPTPRQLAAAASALELPEELRDRLDDAAERYRLDVHEAVGLTWPEVRDINRSNIRDHYELARVLVPRLAASPHNFLFLEGECDWEDEHGIEFLLRDGVVLVCGPQEQLSNSAEWDDHIKVSA